MNQQLDALRQRAELVDSLEAMNREQEGKIQELTENYKKEMALRKKYKNEIENMKGKIRVFARCRPMAEYELARGSQQVVKFIDDCTLELDTSRGPKTFEFDAVYSMTSTQEEVFEDVRSLVESCLDGYNVCVFAYGQVRDLAAPWSIENSLPLTGGSFPPCLLSDWLWQDVHNDWLAGAARPDAENYSDAVSADSGTQPNAHDHCVLLLRGAVQRQFARSVLQAGQVRAILFVRPRGATHARTLF